MSFTLDQLTHWCWERAERGGVKLLEPAALATFYRVSLFEVRRYIPDYSHAVLLLIEDTTSKVKHTFPDTQSTQDYLFDAIMSYFDEASPHKTAIQKIWSDLMWHPMDLLKIFPSLTKVTNSLIDAVYPSSPWLIQEIRYKAFQWTIFQVFLTWLEDNSPDLAKTMAALDQQLKTLQEYLGYLPYWNSLCSSSS